MGHSPLRMWASHRPPVALHGREPGWMCPSSLLPSASATETDTRCSQPPWPPHRGWWGARCSLLAPGFWNTRLQLIKSWFVVSGAEPGWVWFTVVSWWPARSIRMVRSKGSWETRSVAQPLVWPEPSLPRPAPPVPVPAGHRAGEAERSRGGGRARLAG